MTMQNASPKRTRKIASKKRRAHRACSRGEYGEGIPEYMIRLARERRVKICEGLAMPKHRHD